MKRTCSFCRRELSLDNFTTDSSRKHGKTYLCRDCDRLRYRERRVRNPDTFKDKDKRYYLKHRKEIIAKRRQKYKESAHKIRAREAVKIALYNGLIMRSKICELCGEGEEKLEAHHYDYSKQIDIIWLCKRCHRRVDFGKD